MRKTITRNLVLAAMFVALDIVSTRFLYFHPLTVPPNIVRISPQIVIQALCGWALGPWWALASGIAADLLGFFMFPPPFPFFIGYTLSAAVAGLIFGLFLHKRPIRIWRSLMVIGLMTLVVSIGMNTVWSYITYKAGWWATFIGALPWRIGMFPVYGAAVFALQRVLDPYVRRREF